MKICMFVLNDCTRDSRVLKEAKTLTDDGYEVTIVAILYLGCAPSEYKDGFKIIRVNLGGLFNNAKRVVDSVDAALVKHATRLSRIYRNFRRFVNFVARPIAILYYSYLSWKVVKNDPADIYHSHDLDMLPIGYIASRRTKGKLVYDAHELYTELRYVPKVQRVVFRLLERILVHKVDAMITTNEPVARLYSQRYKISKPTVLMNCPMYELQDRLNHKDGLRATLSIPPSQPIIIYSGGLQQDRGLEQMIAAMSLVDKGSLVFLGWGKHERILNNLAVERGLIDRIFIMPPVANDRVSRYISSADVGIICTQNNSLNNYYTSPNKLFEYIIAGLPIVASDFPFLRQIISRYRIGKVCDPTSPKAIAQAIDWVISDKRRLQELKTNAQKAARVINWQNESKKIVEVYDRLR